MSPASSSASRLMSELELQERRNALPDWIAKSVVSPGPSRKRDPDMMDDYANGLMRDQPKKAKTMLSAESEQQDAHNMMIRWAALKNQQDAEAPAQPNNFEKMSGEQEKSHAGISVRNHTHPAMPEWISRPVIDRSWSGITDLAMMDEYWVELKKQQEQETKAFPEDSEDDDDEEMLDVEEEESGGDTRAPSRSLPTYGPHDDEYYWDEMAKALQTAGNSFAAANLARLNEKARSPEVDHSEESTPRKRLCQDFVAALSDLEGATGSHAKQFAGVRRVRKVKIIIEDFDGVSEDVETKDLGEADEEWMYVATMEE